MTAKRRESDDILADLYARKETLLNAVEPISHAEMGYLTQQIVAHETLARLRAERAERVKAKETVIDLDAQIGHWVTLADEQPMVSPEVGTAAPATADEVKPRKRG